MRREHRKHWAALTAALFALAYPYAPVAMRLAHQWTGDPEMAHAILVPPVIAALLYLRRARILSTPPSPSLWGAPLLTLSLLLYFAGLWGGSLFLSSLAGYTAVIAAVLLTLGTSVFNSMAAPLALFVFALPRLAVLYDPLTNPLQRLSAAGASFLLQSLRQDVTRAANVLTIGGFPVLVAEACSGLRFLVPLLFLAAVFVQLRGARPLGAAALLAAAFPLAVAVNAVRIAVLVYLAGANQGVPPEAAHAWLGYPLYAAALGVQVHLARHLTPITESRR